MAVDRVSRRRGGLKGEEKPYPIARVDPSSEPREQERDKKYKSRGKERERERGRFAEDLNARSSDRTTFRGPGV